MPDPGPFPTAAVTTVAFDADDTLWHNERFFKLTQARFAELLADHAPAEGLQDRLHAAETRNLARYGFGVKGFVLSMIETAIEVTEDRVPARVIRDILETGREMLDHPVELLPHAAEAVAAAARHRVLLITKGDLMHQEQKLARSGLGELFHGVEIVADKTPPVYARIFARHGEGAERALMVGNSMKSDVLPVIEAGGWGVFVPHDLVWDYERAEAPADHPRYRALTDLGGLGPLLDDLAQI
ncbi:HAD family hydrolase [Frigidibacter oleivorans]|uniref:HAD family hydrolase n=1 Tax=Frigidibacter oleivorans TaxID=2487129 RepID=UPI000F8D104D|nr:HAD family hydrolase [Frigidibacter oleivorans]